MAQHGKQFVVQAPCVGIDFGTQFSSVAVVKIEKAEVIANAQGMHSTPSIVAFADKEILVGDVAVGQASKNTSNTIVECKRMLGRKPGDESVAKDSKRWKFAVSAKEGKTGVQVDFKGQPTVLTAEYICGQILASLKATAEAFTHAAIRNCVVAVPSYFTSQQRLALIEAAGIAGLSVVRVISEPVAAAIAYDLDKPGADGADASPVRVAVVNMGARTSEVAILDIASGLIEVAGTAVEDGVGGDSVDDVLVAWCVREFKNKHKMDPSESDRSLARLRSGCERAKRQLSQSTSCRIEVESAHEGVDFSAPLSRAKFDEMTSELLGRLTGLARSALQAAQTAHPSLETAVSRVLLVGGPTRIPKVQTLIQQAFGGAELCFSVPPEEAVAVGAAIQAQALVGSKVNTANSHLETVQLNVTPQDILVRLGDGGLHLAVGAGTPVPCRAAFEVSVAGGADSALVELLQRPAPASGGPAVDTEATAVLSLGLQGVKGRPAPITLCIQVEADGALTLTAADAAGAVMQSVTAGARLE